MKRGYLGSWDFAWRLFFSLQAEGWTALQRWISDVWHWRRLHQKVGFVNYNFTWYGMSLWDLQSGSSEHVEYWTNMYLNKEKFGHFVKIKMTFSVTNHNVCSMMSFCPIQFVLMNGILCHLWLSLSSIVIKYVCKFTISLFTFQQTLCLGCHLFWCIPAPILSTDNWVSVSLLLSRTTSHTMSHTHCSHFNPVLCCSLPVSCLRSPIKVSNMFNSVQVRAWFVVLAQDCTANCCWTTL